MAKKERHYHQERDSPFFRLHSKSKLAALLFCTNAKLKELSDGRDYYREFFKPKKDGTLRPIAAPRKDLKALQSRISDLLQRIAPPDYLFAPVSRRSYVDNAAQHLGAQAIRLLDIEDFFPSCSANRVIWFFRTRLECSPDVATIMCRLATRGGTLPQGSPCSPILAYLCYADMWAEISSQVIAANCRLSVYADDITISGRVVPGSLIWSIKQVLRRYGFRYKAQKERSIIHKPAEVTGVIVTPDRLLLPNRQRKKIVDIRNEIKRTKSQAQRAALKTRLQGRLSQARQVENAGS